MGAKVEGRRRLRLCSPMVGSVLHREVKSPVVKRIVMVLPGGAGLLVVAQWY